MAVGPGDPRAGFSLIEMVVVLTIAALAFSIGAVGLSAMKRRATPMRVASEIAETMNAARLLARDRQSEQSVTIDMKAKTVSMGGRDSLTVIPGEYTVKVVAGRETVRALRAIEIVFLPDGTSSGAEILITSPAGDGARVDVNWLTGLSRVVDAKP